MAAVGGTLTYTQRLILDQRWSNVNQVPKRLQCADAERIRIETLALQEKPNDRKESTTQR